MSLPLEDRVEEIAILAKEEMRKSMELDDEDWFGLQRAQTVTIYLRGSDIVAWQATRICELDPQSPSAHMFDGVVFIDDDSESRKQFFVDCNTKLLGCAYHVYKRREWLLNKWYHVASGWVKQP